MTIDRSKLIKLMMMTQSSNDGEALAAVRKANALLKVSNLDWDSFIRSIPVQRPKPPPSRPMGRGTTDNAPSSHQHHFKDPDIPRMLASLMRDSKGGFRDFVESINEAWNKYGYLTERQYEAIINAYEREK